MRPPKTPPPPIVRSGHGSLRAAWPARACCTAAAWASKTSPRCSPSRSWTACWSAARRSIPRRGPSLCRPAPLRYYPAARMYGFLVGVLILDSLVLMTAILLQAGQGGGLASLGGGAGTEQFMGGRQATTLLTRATWWSAGIFLFLSLVLAIMSAQTSAPRSVVGTTGAQPAPLQPAPLAPPAPPPQTPPPHAPPPPPSRQRPPHPWA